MGPLKALRRSQLQLAGDPVVRVHEVSIGLEPALADLCNTACTTQAGGETMFDELWTDWRVFNVVLVQLCRGHLFDDDERLMDSLKGDKRQGVDL